MFHLLATRHADTAQTPLTIYPGMQMVTVDNRLFKIYIYCWPELLDVWVRYLILLRDGQVDTTCRVFVSGSSSFIASGIVGPCSCFEVPLYENTGQHWRSCGVRITVYLRKIQRMVKRFLHARRRRLALAMASHTRLGQGSLLFQLPADLIISLTLQV
jgi:hypothetical protein